MPNMLNIPQMISMTIKHFSLFSNEPNISIVFPKGVFCLAGANGLGKSTFLLALNYTLTGIVPDPLYCTPLRQGRK